MNGEKRELAFIALLLITPAIFVAFIMTLIVGAHLIPYALLVLIVGYFVDFFIVFVVGRL